MKEIEKKYELIPSDREGLYRVKALKCFGCVMIGEIGGYVECENNLSQYGNCWIYNDATVRDKARVQDNAVVWGKAVVQDNAIVCGNAQVYDSTVVCNNANVYDNAEVWDNAVIQNNVIVRGEARIIDNAIVRDNAVVCGEAVIRGNAIISSKRDYIVFKNWWSSGRYFTWTRSNNMWTAGCFYGTGEELIAKAYEDSEESGREYECIVKYVERILNMKKKIQKPFDIEAAKNGAKVETRDGMPVRIICYDKVDGIYPIIVLVNNDGYEACNGYTPDGKLFCSGHGEHDLVIVEEVEETKFKVGDWVINMFEWGDPWLITAVSSDCYELQNAQGYKIGASQLIIDKYYRLWSIKDAKPGDVLISEDDKRPFIFKEFLGHAPSAYCGIDTTDSIYIGTDGPWTMTTVRPATYDERQQFFNKLEEEDYKWDAESFTLSKKRWRDDERAQIDGYFMNGVSQITFLPGYNTCCYYNLFATERQAKSAMAMARISQIMKNDERFGGVVTDKEWCDNHWRYAIIRTKIGLELSLRYYGYEYLAFHTREQAELFLKENEDLVKDYYMMD